MGYMTIEEVADMLGCSTKTVRRYVQQGMPAYRIARRLIFVRSEIEAWVRSRRV